MLTTTRRCAQHKFQLVRIKVTLSHDLEILCPLCICWTDWKKNKLFGKKFSYSSSICDALSCPSVCTQVVCPSVDSVWQFLVCRNIWKVFEDTSNRTMWMWYNNDDVISSLWVYNAALQRVSCLIKGPNYRTEAKFNDAKSYAKHYCFLECIHIL